MPKFKDRKNAYRCSDISGMNQILIDLKPKRSLGELYLNQKIDITNLVNYTNKLKTKDDNITYFHIFATAIGKVIYNRPLLNRFIANRHTYEHKDVSISFVMKVSFEDKAEAIMVNMPLNRDDNIYSISKKIKDKVDSIRINQNRGTGANKAIHFFSKLPNIIRIPIISLFKWCDRHDMLPNFLIKDNIYYSSMIISNLGNLHCGGIYHNVTDFGTCSGIITIGEIKEQIEKVNNRNITKYYCKFGITIDERIADGFYFIKSIQLLEYILNNPQILEERLDEKIEIS